MMNTTTLKNVFEEHNMTEQEIYSNLLNGDSSTVIAVAEMACGDKDVIEVLTIFFMVKIMEKGKLFEPSIVDENIKKVLDVMKERGFKFRINNLLGAFAITFPNGESKIYNSEDVNMKSIFEFISKN